MSRQRVFNKMLAEIPWDGAELANPLTIGGQTTISGPLTVGYIQQTQIAKPANPPVGSMRWYPKADGMYYKLDSNGVESSMQGPQGIQGIQGIQGTQGIQGLPGAPGEVWFTGAGAPPGGTGIIGDWWLNSTNGDYYDKTGTSVWTLRGNLRGPQGIQGTQGIQGDPGPQGIQGPPGAANAAYSTTMTWNSQTATPPNTGQVRSDTGTWATATRLYVETHNDANADIGAFLRALKVGDDLLLQHKTDSSRWARFDISGAAVDHTGWFEIPVTLVEAQGVLPNSGTQIGFVVLTEGATASQWYTGTGTPAPTLGRPGDMYLEGDGDVWQDQDPAGWTQTSTNIRGPQGVPGPVGPEGPPGESIPVQAADTEEFLPADAATTVTLARPPMDIWIVTRDGIAQSEADGHWSLTGSDITFTEAFNGSERVIVSYAFSTIYAKGDKGDTGDTGAQGIQGEQGVKGDTGDLGPTAAIHEEFMPAAAATTLTLSQACQAVLLVARNGVVQSQTDGNYSRAGSLLTFTDAFSGTERVVVEYAQQTASPAPPFDGSGIVDGSITAPKLASGAVTNPKLADQAVTNTKLASDTARANLLTNGGFEIWQRGVGPFSANDVFTADRWSTVVAGTASVGRVAGTFVETGSGMYAAVITLSSGSYCLLNQKLEDWASLRGKTLSFSVRTYQAPANGVQVQLASTGAATNLDVRTFNTGPANQTVTATGFVPGDATGVYVRIGLVLPGTGYFDNAMLVVGSVPADYVPLHPQEDLARCLRYYEKLGGDGRNDLILTGYSGTGSSTNYLAFPWRAVKAVNPTVTVITPTAWHGQNAAAGGVGINTFSEFSVRVHVTSAAAGFFYITNDTGTANVVAEANP